MGLKGTHVKRNSIFNPITNCKSHLTEPSSTDRQKYPSAPPPTYTPVTSFFCGGSITPGLVEHLTQINRGAKIG